MNCTECMSLKAIIQNKEGELAGLRKSIRAAHQINKMLLTKLEQSYNRECFLLEELAKIHNPGKRHREPDAYTELGCVMHIAQEAIEKWTEIKRSDEAENAP